MLKSDSINRKFVEVLPVSDWEVMTDTGWKDVTASNKTVPYTVFTVKTEAGRTLQCADTHILFDENMNEIFAEDCLGVKLQTQDGLELVTEVTSSDIEENMFDLTVDSEEHRYYTDGFLSHNTTCVAAFFVHYMLFNRDKFSAILANKATTAREILHRVQEAYQHLPHWLQQGVLEWNKGSFALENGCRIMASATSSSAIRGFSIHFLFLDEFAFVPNNTADEFFASVYPTITSGKTSKLAIVSTPKGMNHFYKMVMEAESGTNGFNLLKATWKEVPGRDAQWEKENRAILGDVKFSQEMEIQFIGGSDTLISGAKLKSIPIERPLSTTEHLKIYEEPTEGRSYVMTVDTSRGTGGDYSAFLIVDVTELPYRIVAVYRNNTISSILYPGLLLKMANLYNQAAVLIETNDIGEAVANALYFDFEYEQVMMSDGPNLSSFGGKTAGIRTTRRTKAVGCDNMKQLIEGDKIVIRDYDLLFELSNFIAKGASYEADTGHDDLAMCLCIFAYLTTQPAMEDLTSISAKQAILLERMKQAEDDMLPIGFMQTGLETEADGFVF